MAGAGAAVAAAFLLHSVLAVAGAAVAFGGLAAVAAAEVARILARFAQVVPAE